MKQFFNFLSDNPLMRIIVFPLVMGFILLKLYNDGVWFTFYLDVAKEGMYYYFKHMNDAGIAIEFGGQLHIFMLAFFSAYVWNFISLKFKVIGNGCLGIIFTPILLIVKGGVVLYCLFPFGILIYILDLIVTPLKRIITIPKMPSIPKKKEAQ